MGNTMEEAMAFKRGHSKFYKGAHDELYALVESGEVLDRPEGIAGEYRTVKLSIRSDQERQAYPLMDVEIHGPEDPVQTTFLSVLGVKLQPDAKKWIKARAVHPNASKTGISLVARPPIRLK